MASSLSLDVSLSTYHFVLEFLVALSGLLYFARVVGVGEW